MCFTCLLVPAECSFVVVGFQDLNARVEERLSATKKPKQYGSRNMLQRDMLDLHPVYRYFVSGSKCGFSKFFFCHLCQRDVGMIARGSGEFARHFRSDRHWRNDVTYRVHTGLPVLNQLMEPLTLSESQLANYKSLAFRGFGGRVYLSGGSCTRTRYSGVSSAIHDARFQFLRSPSDLTFQ